MALELDTVGATLLTRNLGIGDVAWHCGISSCRLFPPLVLFGLCPNWFITLHTILWRKIYASIQRLTLALERADFGFKCSAWAKSRTSIYSKGMLCMWYLQLRFLHIHTSLIFAVNYLIPTLSSFTRNHSSFSIGTIIFRSCSTAGMPLSPRHLLV